MNDVTFSLSNRILFGCFTFVFFATNLREVVVAETKVVADKLAKIRLLFLCFREWQFGRPSNGTIPVAGGSFRIRPKIN